MPGSIRRDHSLHTCIEAFCKSNYSLELEQEEKVIKADKFASSQMDQAGSGLIGVSLEHREGTFDASTAYRLQQTLRHDDIEEASALDRTRKARTLVAVSPDRSVHRPPVRSNSMELKSVARRD